MKNKKPSRTALKVAFNILTLASKPGMEKILPPGTVKATERLLIASGVVGATAIRWSRSPRMVSIYKAFDWMLPGQFEAFAYRKAFCEYQVRAGIAAGATQILVLGAGYDTMGWRLAPEFAGVSFFEMDHPATAKFKSRGIAAMERRDNLILLAEDLGQRRLEDVLRSNEAWDEVAQTVIIAEGLVMYLPSEAVRNLFCQCAAIAGPDSRVCFSYLPMGKDGRPYVGRWTGLMVWLQKAVGEPWLWSIRPEKIGIFLKETGWTISRERVEKQEQYGVEFFCAATK